MPGKYQLHLTPEQVNELEEVRDRKGKPHEREKAAALLKIHQGQSVHQVAATGLLKRRRTHTVLAWVHRYQAQGRQGLAVAAGRGRRPRFFPPQP